MAAARKLMHSVFFTLKASSAEARQRLLAACDKYLTGHPGALSFSTGTRAEKLDRPVNDRDFDVSLHILFSDEEAHDRYQRAPRHLQFVEENKETWKQVRVFDSLIAD